MCYLTLSYDVASGSEIMPCNKIDKPQLVSRYTEIIQIYRNYYDKNYNLFTAEMRFQSNSNIRAPVLLN